MMLFAVKIGATAIVVAVMAVVIALFCTNHKRIEKLMEYVVGGCTVIAACTLIPLVLSVIWSA